MTLFTNSQRHLAESVSGLMHCNPFLAERTLLQRQILGDELEPETPDVWSNQPGYRESPNIQRIADLAEKLVQDVKCVLHGGSAEQGEQDRRLYEDIALFHLFHRYRHKLYKTYQDRATAIPYWDEFLADCQRWLGVLRPQGTMSGDEAAHFLACLFQVRRAFELGFEYLGTSTSAAGLRAAIWQSVFTHDLRRYRRALYGRMHKISTLVIGESGTGKELVARAIAYSRYIAFDTERKHFTDQFADAFHPINLSELTPDIIASELFGHAKGAFTGAHQDHEGYLEYCRPNEAVFLDEIGDLSADLQVKLLRVMQSRRFRRVGDTTERDFAGKIVSATNRDLPSEMESGRFRQDFYYRLCSDIIRTPRLRDQISEKPDDLHTFVRFIAEGEAGAEEAEQLTEEVIEHIHTSPSLGKDYEWPGNFRELEQCVRNVMVRGTYQPCKLSDVASCGLGYWPQLRSVLRQGPSENLTLDQLAREYCRAIYRQTGSLKNTATQLGCDPRTVRKYVEEDDTDAPVSAPKLPR